MIIIYIFVVYKITNKAMSKPTKKRINYNIEVLNIVAEKYDFSTSYVKAALRGDRKGTMPDVLIKEYNKLNKADKEIKAAGLKALQQKAEKIDN